MMVSLPKIDAPALTARRQLAEYNRRPDCIGAALSAPYCAPIAASSAAGLTGLTR